MIVETKISNLLRNQETIISPEEANESGLLRVHKIDFKGNIHFKEKKTRTKMIIIKKNNFIISGINVLKGASVLYTGDKNILATIHYSAYEVNKDQLYLPYFIHYLRSSHFLQQLTNIKRSGIKTEIKPKQLLSILIKLPKDIDDQKKRANIIDKNIIKINKLKSLLKRQKESLPKIYELIYSEIYQEALKNGNIVKLQDLIIDKPKNGFSPKPVNYETKNKSLILSATSSGFFKKEKFKFVEGVNDKIKKNPSLLIKKNDILIQRGNIRELVGVSAVIEDEIENYIYPDLMMKIVCKSIILPKFLHCLLMSLEVRNYFRSKASGTSKSMPKINQPTVQNTLIPFIDDLNIQKKLIKKSIEKISKIKKLNKIVQNVKLEQEIENQILDKYLLD